MRGSAITQEQKLDFLEYIRQGYIRPEAARMTREDLTGSDFRKLCNPNSVHYDERFARCYDQAVEVGSEHEDNLLDRLRESALGRALTISDRLLEKEMMIHDPNWAFLRSQRIDVNTNLEALVHQHFGHLGAEQLRQIISLAKENERANELLNEIDNEENIIDEVSYPELEAGEQSDAQEAAA